jgi:hypothetical protein
MISPNNQPALLQLVKMADYSGSQSSGSVFQIGDVHLPTQTDPLVWKNMVAWIQSVSSEQRLRAVIIPGDGTSDGPETDSINFYDPFRQLDSVVPYSIVTGNHDYYGTANDRNSYLDTRLGSGYTGNVFRVAGKPSAGSYVQATIGGVPVLILGLEWSPRDACVVWADAVLKAFAAANPSGIAIVHTHAYLYSDSTRYDWATKNTAQDWNPHVYNVTPDDGIWDGEELWGKAFTGQSLGLIQGNSCVKMVLCGHVLYGGRGRLVSTRPDGTKCVQVLFNTQFDADAAYGWVRRYSINTQSRTITAITYSPKREIFNFMPTDLFSVSYA